MKSTDMVSYPRLQAECRAHGWFDLPFSLWRVNAVSKAVFDYLMPPGAVIERGGMRDYLDHLAPIYRAIRALGKLRPDAQGIRKAEYCGRQLCLVPNQIGSLTMIFPEEYRPEDFAVRAHLSPTQTRTRNAKR